MENQQVAESAPRIGKELAVERRCSGPSTECVWHADNLRRSYAVPMPHKRHLLSVLVVWCACLIGLVACAESEGGVRVPQECPSSDAADMTEISVQRAELLLGYSEADAQQCAAQLGWAFRVGQRDGESFALTEDYSLQRVTVVVVDDRVTAIAVG